MTRHHQDIPEYWKPKTGPKAQTANIVQTDKARFTILSTGLIRCEYQKSGHFEDRPSQIVWYRDFSAVSFRTQKGKEWLEIETDDLLLRYRLSRRFSRRNLTILVKANRRRWRFGQEDGRNLKGTRRTLDMIDGRAPLKKGLMSRNGWSWIDDSKSLVLVNDWPRTRTHRGIDGYFFGHGTDFQETLRDWYRLTGFPPLLPRAVLGNWWSRYYAYDETSLKALISRFESEGVPLSVCVIDMDWHLVDIPKEYGSGWTGFTWNTELFPDPKGMLSWLHQKGLLSSLNLHPASGIRPHEAAYLGTAEFMGIDPESQKTVRFDATDPRFMRAYFDKVLHPLEDSGVDFWWIDWQQGRRTAIKGLDPLWMLNHLHFLDSGREGKRPFTFSRYSGPGAHRTPIGFSGDSFASWASLRFQPEFTARAANIGYGWWSHDVGGHHFGRSDSELYARWVQQGVFSPIMRLHSTQGGMHRREPWRHRGDAATTAAEFLRFRHRLIPYLYSAVRQSAMKGCPLVRPLYFENPEDPQTYRHHTVHWFGSELISAPVVEKARRPLEQARRRFYLPHGRWYDFSTGIVYEGGRVRSRYYRLEEHPVFAKAGAIVPLTGQTPLNDTGNPKNLVLEIFPGSNNRFVLFEDDGGEGASESLIRLDWTESEMVLSVDLAQAAPWLPDTRNITLRLRNLREQVRFEVRIDDEIVAPTVGQSNRISIHGGPAMEVFLSNIDNGSRIQVKASHPEGVERMDREDADKSLDRVYAILDRAQGGNHRKYRLWKKLSARESQAARRRFLTGKFFLSRRLRRALIEQFDEI